MNLKNKKHRVRSVMFFIEKKQRDCLECKMVPCFFCIYYKIIGKIENIDNLIKIKKYIDKT